MRGGKRQQSVREERQTTKRQKTTAPNGSDTLLFLRQWGDSSGSSDEDYVPPAEEDEEDDMDEEAHQEYADPHTAQMLRELHEDPDWVNTQLLPSRTSNDQDDTAIYQQFIEMLKTNHDRDPALDEEEDEDDENDEDYNYLEDAVRLEQEEADPYAEDETIRVSQRELEELMQESSGNHRAVETRHSKKFRSADKPRKEKETTVSRPVGGGNGFRPIRPDIPGMLAMGSSLFTREQVNRLIRQMDEHAQLLAQLLFFSRQKESDFQIFETTYQMFLELLNWRDASSAYLNLQRHTQHSLMIHPSSACYANMIPRAIPPHIPQQPPMTRPAVMLTPSLPPSVPSVPSMGSNNADMSMESGTTQLSSQPVGGGNNVTVTITVRKSIFDCPVLRGCWVIFDNLKHGPDPQWPRILSQTLNQLKDLLNPLIVPVFEKPSDNLTRLPNKLKFTPAEDRLLALGLQTYGADFKRIQQEFLPTKHEKQLFHRYKNMSCRRAPPNPIKDYRLGAKSDLNQQEESILQRAVQWFGPQFSLISTNFLPNHDAATLFTHWTRMQNAAVKPRARSTKKKQTPSMDNQPDNTWSPAQVNSSGLPESAASLTMSQQVNQQVNRQSANPMLLPRPPPGYPPVYPFPVMTGPPPGPLSGHPPPLMPRPLAAPTVTPSIAPQPALPWTGTRMMIFGQTGLQSSHPQPPQQPPLSSPFYSDPMPVPSSSSSSSSSSSIHQQQLISHTHTGAGSTVAQSRGSAHPHNHEGTTASGHDRRIHSSDVANISRQPPTVQTSGDRNVILHDDNSRTGMSSLLDMGNSNGTVTDLQTAIPFEWGQNDSRMSLGGLFNDFSNNSLLGLNSASNQSGTAIQEPNVHAPTASTVSAPIAESISESDEPAQEYADDEPSYHRIEDDSEAVEFEREELHSDEEEGNVFETEELSDSDDESDSISIQEKPIQPSMNTTQQTTHQSGQVPSQVVQTSNGIDSLSSPVSQSKVDYSRSAFSPFFKSPDKSVRRLPVHTLDSPSSSKLFSSNHHHNTQIGSTTQDSIGQSGQQPIQLADSTRSDHARTASSLVIAPTIPSFSSSSSSSFNASLLPPAAPSTPRFAAAASQPNNMNTDSQPLSDNSMIYNGTVIQWSREEDRELLTTALSQGAKPEVWEQLSRQWAGRKTSDMIAQRFKHLHLKFFQAV